MLPNWWSKQLLIISQNKLLKKHLIIAPIIMTIAWSIGTYLGINIGHNLSDSVPYKWFIMTKRFGALKQGQYVVFQQQIDGKFGLLVKKIVGMPGDPILVKPDGIWVGETYVGITKKFSRRGKPLLWVAPRVIPHNQYFVSGTSVDSFDSRYQEIGLIKKEYIISRAFPLW